MAKPNYQFEKRQRDLAKKTKQEEKRRQKLAGKVDGEQSADSADDSSDAAAPSDTGSAQVSYKQRRKMRSTRASAAVARLNERSSGHHYTMALTGDGLFKLRERLAEGDKEVSAALPLDDFVRFVKHYGATGNPAHHEK